MTISKSPRQPQLSAGGVWMRRKVEILDDIGIEQIFELPGGSAVHDAYANVITPAVGTAATAAVTLDRPVVVLDAALDLTVAGVSDYRTAAAHSIADVPGHRDVSANCTFTNVTSFPIVEFGVLVSPATTDTLNAYSHAGVSSPEGDGADELESESESEPEPEPEPETPCEDDA